LPTVGQATVNFRQILTQAKVYLDGTTTLATLYDAAGENTVADPTVSGTTVSFYAVPGNYIIKTSSTAGTETTRVTVNSPNPDANTVLTKSVGDTLYVPLERRGALQQNLVGWAFDPAGATGATSLVAGEEVLIRVLAEEDASVNTVTIGLANTPAGVTNAFVGLRSAAGALLGSSADAAATVNAATVGRLSIPLSASVAVTEGTVYYVSILVGAGTTLPSLARATTNSVLNDGLVAGTYRVMTAGTGLTALPASVTVASATESTTAFYASIAA